jgi:hypothetical protein
MNSENSKVSKNLLPNASFELDFGQAKHDWIKYNPGEGASDNWTDFFNPMTLKLAATDQVPKVKPAIQAMADAPDGSRIAVLVAANGRPAHLTSPVVPMKGGQAYTLSAYARSDASGATLRLGLWNRPMDWHETPDAQSEPFPVGTQWRRYELTFNLASYFDLGAVDLIASTDTEAKVCVDAVQLEQGPRATPFETRYPLEARLTAHKYFSGMLHLLGDPLELDLVCYVTGQAESTGDLKLTIENFEGKVVHTEHVHCPNTAGLSTHTLALDFPLVGNFRARLFSAANEAVDVSSYGYMFTVHPVMHCGFGYEEPAPEEKDFQGILYSREGRIHQLPAERIRLPRYASEGMWNFTITDDNMIHLMAVSATNEANAELMRSGDGGRTWDVVKVTRPVQSVLSDGTFLTMHSPSIRGEPGLTEDGRVQLYCSGDTGQTWESLGGPGPFPGPPQCGPVTQLSNGTLIWPIGVAMSGTNHVTYAFRSTDGGRNWSEGYPICPTGEPSVIERASGRLLAVVRNNLPPRSDAWPVFLEDRYQDAWRLWAMQYGAFDPRPQVNRPHDLLWHADSHVNLSVLGSVQKNVLLADSDDGGVTWTNVRDGSNLLGEMHGSAVELPDGRVVLMHVHRVPWLHGGERARVSRDGGNRWDEETYYLSTVLTYPEYSTNCVLPPELADGEAGMILTVLGDRPNALGLDRPGLMQAVRWRPLP